MSKPNSSPSLNPWEALFSSATRPQAVAVASSPDDDGDVGEGDAQTSSYDTSAHASSPPPVRGGYTILIQHSMTPKSQRQWALASTMATSVERSSRPNGRGSSATSLPSAMTSLSLNSSSATMRTFQGSWFGMTGPFVVRQAFEELCQRCEGSVVFVSTLGTSGVLDLDDLDGMNSSQAGNSNSDDHGYHRGQHDNTLLKFCQYGALVDLASDPFGWEEDIVEDQCDSSFVQRSNMNKLQPIAMAIRRAAAAVESRRRLSAGPEQTQKNQQKMQQPIPIVFESLTPLLQLHGVEKIGMLIKSLGRVLPSTSIVSSGINQPILSPIIAPMLYESLRPSEHRCLEDISDAMIHLNLIDTPDNNVPISDPSSTAVVSGVMDLVRRGGGGVGGLGGKLIHHCVPTHVMMRSGSDSIHPTDARDCCYWILENDENSVVEKIGKEKQVVSNQSGKSTKTTENADQQTQSAPSSRPRIYLQDDDPEFDDFDEEDDLDDDLDL